MIKFNNLGLGVPTTKLLQETRCYIFENSKNKVLLENNTKMTQKIEKIVIISITTPIAILSIAHQLLLVVLQCYNNIFIAIENH
jgi:hypothetical protein